MLLADYAQVADGKLTVVGGGWSLTGPEPTPFGIAILVHVPWDQANRRHTLRLELVDADGAPVTMPGDERGGGRPVVFLDDIEFEVGGPPGSSRARRSSCRSRSTPARCRSSRAAGTSGGCRSTARATRTGGLPSAFALEEEPA